jgi:hypothetical protein
MSCYQPFEAGGADPTFQPLGGDQVLVRWTELGARPDDAMLCEGEWSVDELAAAQRGEADLDLATIREWPLADRLATLRAERDQLTARRDEMVNQNPELKSRRAR